MADDQKREALLMDIFASLDQKKRGFVSKVELAHILDAMQADCSSKLPLPDALLPANIPRDTKATVQDLKLWFQGLSLAELEDVRWFSESVVKVESELREVWCTAVMTWRDRVDTLYKQDLHRYLLASQPERVARWLLLRTSMDRSESRSPGAEKPNIPGLGISQQEVEVLFADETADEINRFSAVIEPFLRALQLRDLLDTTAKQGEIALECPPEVDAKVVEILGQLTELVTSHRDLACLLIHQSLLGYLSALICTRATSIAAVASASKLILAILDHRIHESAREYEFQCREMVATFLEIDFDPSCGAFDLQAERRQLVAGPRFPGRMCLLHRNPKQETISEWVGALITLQSDFDRGEMLDVLIKYEEKGHLLASEGGSRQDENTPIPISVFSFGRTVPFILSRLDLASHHTLHEHRTPMRSHLWKLLVNVLSSAGDRGRLLFRSGEGMRVICNVLRGDSWGAEHPELSLAEEADLKEEEEELYADQKTSWERDDAVNSWPAVEYFEGAKEGYRYYAMDFLDDKFYGSKDRVLAKAFLEYMGSPGMWGPEALVQEMIWYPNTLQVLCRVRPTPLALLRLLLGDPSFPDYLMRAAQLISQETIDRSLKHVVGADATHLSLFPTVFPTSTSLEHEAFRNSTLEVQTYNVVLRILAHAYHNLQRTAQEISEQPNPEGSAEDPAQIEECCKLLASQLHLSENEALNLGVTILLEIRKVVHKALLLSESLAKVREAAAVAPETTPGATSSSSTPRRGDQYLLQIAQALQSSVNGSARTEGIIPGEFLVTLRLVQLLRLRYPSLPQFFVDLEGLLEEIVGSRKSVPPPPPPTDAGSDSIRVNLPEVVVRRSLLSDFGRSSPHAIAVGLNNVLRYYQELPIWTADPSDTSPEEAQIQSEAAQRGKALVAIAFGYLSFYMPQTVTVKAGASGLATALNLSTSIVLEVKETLSHFQAAFSNYQDTKDFHQLQNALTNNCLVYRPGNSSMIVLEVLVSGIKVLFVCLSGTWLHWPCGSLPDDSVEGHVRAYFGS
eukprot:TRINITY_DN35538_c0_g1_i1.p1 TRINITY_DN35538_c0_g1~~TRINITY_DN35538_c0_g1_i1.p1  ORF type:complete len:1050 (+),score=176.99 TRINITY_DN35538_c0_g1_i1:78-3152(+)